MVSFLGENVTAGFYNFKPVIDNASSSTALAPAIIQLIYPCKLGIG